MTTQHNEFTFIKPNASIGILGGSFDPPHLCHELLALSFLALEPIDELWIIPCKNHAFKNDLSDFKHRMIMCTTAFKRIHHVRVLDIENTLSSPNYTIQTLEYILKNRPDLSLFFGIGSDLIHDFHTWHRVQDIVTLSSIIIFEREGYPINAIPPILRSSRIHEGYRLPNTNSTQLRNYFRAKNKPKTRSFLDRDVIKYIENHRLYMD